MTASYVCAADLQVALGAWSAERDARRTEVSRREGELRLAELGLSTVVTVTTGADVGANLLRSDEPEWGTTLQMDAGINYRHDAVAVARAQTNLLTAHRREASQHRTDVLSALIALSRLRAAERLAAQTNATATEAEGLAASVRQSAVIAYGAAEEGLGVGQASGSPGISVDDEALRAAAPDVVLNIRELDLAAARARATATGRAGEVANALAELGRLGLTAQALNLASPANEGWGAANCLSLAPGPAFRTEGPRLPQPQAHTSLERQLLELAVEVATAQHSRASLGPLRDLSMTAHYQEGGARLLAEVDLAGGRPGAGVNFRLRDSTAHNWGVGVSATIRIDDSMGDALAAARAQLTDTHAAVAEFDESFAQRVSSEVAALESVWLSLAFAIEALSIASDRLELAVEERDVTRAEQVVARSVDALEREYQSYLRALARYLGAFDLSWSALLSEN